MGMPVRNRHDPDDEADEHGPSSGKKSENQTDGRESKTNLKNDTDEERQDSDDEESSSKDDQPKKPTFFQKTWFKITAAVIVGVLLIAALVYWLFARQYEDTDDAFIDTHIVHISPQVAGQITRIAVNDNQRVRLGQPLVDIDSSDARAKLSQAQAQEAQAETQYRQAIATEAGNQAQANSASADLARYRLLQRTSPLAVAQQQIDQAEATAKNAIAQRDAARAQIAGAQAQIKAYNAQIATAQLTLGYTHIVAPADGTIAQRTVAVGNYVTPGQELMAVVPLHIWVTANFKETQLQRMRVGQPVTIDVDSCDKEVRGHVDSIQRGAGQAFGILPPENATGNYVKVVQRVPVKILLDRIPKGCVLGPGMSVEPSVKVR
jgi:membrane fusion protein (multidrug efflux system)